MWLHRSNQFFLYIIINVLYALNIVCAETSSSVPTLNCPDFVAHVGKEIIRNAEKVAQQRHEHAIRKALLHYDTDSVSTEGIDEEALDKVQFKKYNIDAPGALPDFHEELERSIYVTTPPLLSREECAQVIKDAEEYVQTKESWGRHQSGQYEISGVWVKDVPKVREWFNQLVRLRLFPLLQRLYPDFVEDFNDLCVDSAYLFKYTPETGRRTEIHTDCGCLSFTMALNSPEDYTGGGTWFEGLEKEDSPIVKMDIGQVTLRPGGVKHAGCAVESGERYIIGGFCMNRKKVEKVRMLLNPDPTLPIQEQCSLLEAAVAMNPSCDTSFNLLANHYEQTGNQVKAQQVLEYGLKYVHPGASDLAYSLGSIYVQQGKFEKVKECMEICLTMDNYDIDAMTTMAEACRALGDQEGEQQYYMRIVNAPAAAPKRVASAFCNLGVLHEGTEEEIVFYLKSLQIIPNSFAPNFSLGAAYAGRKQWKEAAEAFRSSIQHATKEEDEIAGLQALYTASKHILMMDSNVPPPTSQEDIIQRFHDIMGKENYQKLADSMGRK